MIKTILVLAVGFGIGYAVYHPRETKGAAGVVSSAASSVAASVQDCAQKCAAEGKK